MPNIRTKHKLYTKFSGKWKRCRDAIEGGDAIREAGEIYLPRLVDQNPQEYHAYLQRPCFYDATARTAEALAGLVFSKPAVVDVPAALEAMLEDIDAAGGDLEDFARKLVDEALAVGRGLIVVNHNGDPLNPGTLANPSGRPYLSYYAAETVLDWRTAPVNGELINTYIKVVETVKLPGDDEFTQIEREQFRIFDIDAEGYRQRVFIESTKDGTTGLQLIEETRPMLNGKPWDRIPAIIMSLNGTADPGPIPLLPVADTNISHFRTMADLEHGAHYTALPTPWFAGVNLPKGEKIRLGSSEAICLTAADAKCGFLEFTGAGIAKLEALADRKEHQMSALGARLLMQQKAGVESGWALSIKQSGESAALMRVAQTVSTALTGAVQLMAEWSGNSDTESINVELNTDFVDSSLDAPTITALLAAFQAGTLSKETFVYNLQKGDRLQEGDTVQDELDRIDTEGPALGMIDPAADPLADPGASGPSGPTGPTGPVPPKKKGKNGKGAQA